MRTSLDVATARKPAPPAASTDRRAPLKVGVAVVCFALSGAIIGQQLDWWHLWGEPPSPETGLPTTPAEIVRAEQAKSTLQREATRGGAANAPKHVQAGP